MCVLSHAFSLREHIQAGRDAGRHGHVRWPTTVGVPKESTHHNLALNEVSGPADGAAAMTGLHQLCLFSLFGGLAWMLPAGPRTEWNRCPITREVLHCCARGVVESGVSGQSKPYLPFCAWSEANAASSRHDSPGQLTHHHIGLPGWRACCCRIERSGLTN